MFYLDMELLPATQTPTTETAAIGNAEAANSICEPLTLQELEVPIFFEQSDTATHPESHAFSLFEGRRVALIPEAFYDPSQSEVVRFAWAIMHDIHGDEGRRVKPVFEEQAYELNGVSHMAGVAWLTAREFSGALPQDMDPGHKEHLIDLITAAALLHDAREKNGDSKLTTERMASITAINTDGETTSFRDVWVRKYGQTSYEMLEDTIAAMTNTRYEPSNPSVGKDKELERKKFFYLEHVTEDIVPHKLARIIKMFDWLHNCQAFTDTTSKEADPNAKYVQPISVYNEHFPDTLSPPEEGVEKLLAIEKELGVNLSAAHHRIMEKHRPSSDPDQYPEISKEILAWTVSQPSLAKKSSRPRSLTAPYRLKSYNSAP